MAESPAHKFGQIIGDLLELTIQPSLERFAKKNKLYLDKKGKRKTRKGTKVSWLDLKDNKHDLDFVIERGGTDTIIGKPVAFIEIAWRRYTRHSRNKAQEIQGAIMPLAEKYKHNSPFKGVILAGEFTKGAINQLESLGFCILYFPYATVVKAFKKAGIDASTNDSTTEADVLEKISAFNALTDKTIISKEMVRLNKAGVEAFIASLVVSVTRHIETVMILPLHGQESVLKSVLDAITFLKGYDEEIQSVPVLKYEVVIRYNNGDWIDGSFHNKQDAIDFLERA